MLRGGLLVAVFVLHLIGCRSGARAKLLDIPKKIFIVGQNNELETP